MKTKMFVSRIALLILGAIAALRPQPAVADVPPLDFPAACLPSLLSQTFFINAPEDSQWGLAVLPVSGGNDRADYVTVWRMSCGGDKAALQLRLSPWDLIFNSPVSFPRLTVRQNGHDTDIEALRVSSPSSLYDPTPIAAGTANASPGMFVLKSAGGGVDLNGALSLLVRHPVTGAVALTLDIPAYTPKPPMGLPINGRYVGNFYDPAKSGEGVLVEIVDLGTPQPNGHQRHYLQYSWFTYDNNGRPFWISGGGEFADGDTHVHMQAIYRGGGRFAGLKAASDVTPWGTVDMEFTDCNTLRIGYSGNAGLPASVPSGNGQLEWKRLTGVSGNRCD